VSAHLHLDPAELRAAAAAVQGLLPALLPAALDPSDADSLARHDPALGAERDRLAAAVLRVGRELAELAAALCAASTAADTAETAVVRAVTATDR